MERKGLATQKVNGKTGLIVLLILAVPAFFWFRFLYNTFFTDSPTPQMQKMRDAMMQPHPTPPAASAAKHPDAKKPATGAGEKGEPKTTP